jgi:hypothetical protein
MIRADSRMGMYLLPDRSGKKAHTTQMMNRYLKWLSRALGFEMDVLTHDLRCLVGSSVYTTCEYAVAIGAD